jgi:hypothetical protein
VDPAEFSRDLGRQYAFQDAVRQIWPLEGYLLAQQLHEAKALEVEVSEWSAVTLAKKRSKK